MAKNKKQIEKEVKEYMKLPYTIKLIPEEDGTYFVEVEELPGCMSEGDTPEEALAMIKEAMEGWIESNLERGLQIPLPNIMKEYSGKFLLRVPKSLHQRLAEAAKKEGVSLNQYVVSLLSEKLTLKEIYKKIESLEKKGEKQRQKRDRIWTGKIIDINAETNEWGGESNEKQYRVQ